MHESLGEHLQKKMEPDERVGRRPDAFQVPGIPLRLPSLYIGTVTSAYYQSKIKPK